jgi:ParB family transcriptional regulator, chromosome partitioning protein
MDMQVPLNRLKFGHEDGGGINARVTGREDGIAALAANIHANGQIENLIVKDAGDGFYAVANGNRRLAAFHMIYGTESNQPINCTLHDVDETKGFEFSLTTAVTAEQLHPVDQYEGFARLRERGQTDEEIARKYGLSEHEVAQALALGALSPAVRDAWRKGEIKASVAKAFTLADDHAAQDEVIARCREKERLRDLDDEDVKTALRVGLSEAGSLVEFVGFDAYVAAGGKVTRDLFGTDHKVSDAKLAKKLADKKLAEECARLTKEGWSFALAGVTNKWEYSSLDPASESSDEEAARLATLEAVFDPAGDEPRFGRSLVFNELTANQQKAYLEHRALEDKIARRGFMSASTITAC